MADGACRSSGSAARAGGRRRPRRSGALRQHGLDALRLVVPRFQRPDRRQLAGLHARVRGAHARLRSCGVQVDRATGPRAGDGVKRPEGCVAGRVPRQLCSPCARGQSPHAGAPRRRHIWTPGARRQRPRTLGRHQGATSGRRARVAVPPRAGAPRRRRIWTPFRGGSPAAGGEWRKTGHMLAKFAIHRIGTGERRGERRADPAQSARRALR